MFPLIPPPWSRTGEGGIESSNPLIHAPFQHHNTETAVATAASWNQSSFYWRFPREFQWFASLMFLLSSSSSPETPPLLLAKRTHARMDATALTKIALNKSVETVTHMYALCMHANAHTHIETITSGNNDHERNTVWSWSCLSYTAALMLNWGKKGRASHIFIVDGNPLSNVKKNRLYLGMLRIFCVCVCVCGFLTLLVGAFSCTAKYNVLNSEWSCCSN